MQACKLLPVYNPPPCWHWRGCRGVPACLHSHPMFLKRRDLSYIFDGCYLTKPTGRGGGRAAGAVPGGCGGGAAGCAGARVGGTAAALHVRQRGGVPAAGHTGASLGFGDEGLLLGGPPTLAEQRRLGAGVRGTRAVRLSARVRRLACWHAAWMTMCGRVGIPGTAVPRGTCSWSHKCCRWGVGWVEQSARVRGTST